MGMPRGLIKANAYYNNLEAWNDWHKLVAKAQAMGFGDIAAKFAPPEGAGWRKVDKSIAKLRKELNDRTPAY